MNVASRCLAHLESSSSSSSSSSPVVTSLRYSFELSVDRLRQGLRKTAPEEEEEEEQDDDSVVLQPDQKARMY